MGRSKVNKMKNILSALNISSLNNAKLYFVSPHLDDAIFSAGSLLYSVRKNSHLKVINVFTKGRNSLNTIAAKKFIKDCNYIDIDTLYSDRVAEDKQIFNKLDIEVQYLDHVDCLWRLNQTLASSKVLRAIGKIVPEILHIYPTYRFHAGIGRIFSADNGLVDDIYHELVKITKNDPEAIIFCPKGIGNHVDHLVVKAASDKLKCKKVYWADFPYSIIKSKFSKQLESSNYIYNKYLDKKIELSYMYKTQVPTIFPNGKITKAPEYYFADFKI